MSPKTPEIEDRADAARAGRARRVLAVQVQLVEPENLWSPFSHGADAAPPTPPTPPPEITGVESAEDLMTLAQTNYRVGTHAAEHLVRHPKATPSQRGLAHAVLVLERPVASLDAALTAAVESGDIALVEGVLEHFGDIRSWSQAPTFLRNLYDGSDSHITALLVKKGLPPVEQDMPGPGLTGFVAAAAPHFAGVSPKDHWRLVINGNMHAAGPLCFDRREQGYLAAMMSGMQNMLDTLDAKVTPKLLCRLHDVAVNSVRSGSAYFPTGFRATGSSFGLLPGRTNSPDGMEELYEKMEPGGVLHGWSNLVAAGNHPVLSSHKTTPSVVREKVAGLLTRYHEEIGSATGEHAKLTAIVRCVQDLEQLHPFTDGNIRTMVFLLANKLLMQNGMPPALYPDPNVFDAFSTQELVGVIKAGQAQFLALKQYP